MLISADKLIDYVESEISLHAEIAKEDAISFGEDKFKRGYVMAMNLIKLYVKNRADIRPSESIDG